MILNPQLVDLTKQALSRLIYQPSYYPKHVLEVITILHTAGSLHNEFISSGTNFNYTSRIYSNTLVYFDSHMLNSFL